MRILKAAVLLILGTGALLHGGSALADIRIVTAIKPLELLVRAIATDDMQINTLVPPGASPHNYSMKPSGRRALESANVIFWVGPDMETFLSRLLTGNEFGGRSVALMPADTPGANTNHGDNHHEAQHQGHNHGDGEDPHVWVDPELAITMAKTIRDALVQLDGTEASALDRNLETLQASVMEKDGEIRQQLQSLQGASLFIYHSAFTRFADHYNLSVDGILTLNAELSPGARHIADIQNRLQSANQPCLLIEPQFSRQWWRSITQGLDVTISTWDPLATNIEPDSAGYTKFQQSIADAALKCAKP